MLIKDLSLRASPQTHGRGQSKHAWPMDLPLPKGGNVMDNAVSFFKFIKSVI